MCKHIGLAQIQGNYEKAIKHLAIVNGISNEEAESYVESSFKIWEKRSQNDWKLDITVLENKKDE